MNNRILFLVSMLLLFGNMLHYFMPTDLLNWEVYVIAREAIICYAFYMWYSSVSYRDPFKKSLSMAFFFDAIFNIIKLLLRWEKSGYTTFLSGNRDDDMLYLVIQLSIIMLILTYWFFLNKRWESIKGIKVIDPGVYMIADYPINFKQFIGTFFGGTIGRTRILVISSGGARRIYGTKRGMYYFTNRITSDFMYQVKLNDINPDLFMKECDSFICRPLKFDIIKNNCVTCWDDLFKIFGIKINYWKLDFIPSVFILKNIIKNNKNKNDRKKHKRL